MLRRLAPSIAPPRDTLLFSPCRDASKDRLINGTKCRYLTYNKSLGVKKIKMKENKIIRLVAQKIYPEVKAFTPEVEAAWNKDYSERHMPLSIKAKGLSKVARY